MNIVFNIGNSADVDVNLNSVYTVLCVYPPYINMCVCVYLPTPPLGQDVTQGQFLNRVLKV